MLRSFIESMQLAKMMLSGISLVSSTLQRSQSKSNSRQEIRRKSSADTVNLAGDIICGSAGHNNQGV